jgi:hypothetical protein
VTATIAAGEPGVTEIELLRPGAGQAGSEALLQVLERHTQRLAATLAGEL